MAISKITDAARDAASVGALADRPNSTARDGYSGLTPTQLKAKFDALPKLNTAKINEIIDLINLGLTVSSVAVPAGTPPSVEITETPGEPINLKFSIPTAIPSLWIGTQQEYENLSSHNPDVLYFIIEPL